jgi:DNA-directed RNA polymerase subunit beta
MILTTYQTVVRTVGEQLSQQFGVGLAYGYHCERMNVRDNEVFTPIDLINAKHYHLLSTLSGTNQLSQFMDQTNPLAEITHREDYLHWTRWTFERRAGFEVRDVHYTLRTDVYVPLKHQRDQTLV